MSTSRGRGELFAFYTDYDDKIESVATGAVTPDGRTVVQSQNIGEVTLYGVEAGLGFVVSDALEVYSVLNYTRGEEERPGDDQPADRIPPLNGKVGVRYTVAPGVTFEPYVTFADRQDRLSDRDIEDPRIDPNGTAGWLTLNANFSWRLSDRTELVVRAENVLDKSYREHSSGLDAPGRNVGLTFDMRF